MFKSKSQKEFEKRAAIKKTMNMMNRHIYKLEEQKKVYINAAKSAKQKGLNAQLNLAISGLKMTMSQIKKAQEMLLNFEITSQMKDMSMMTSEFLKGLGALSKEMSKLTDTKEFSKVQKQFENAMAGVENQTEQMDIFLDMNESSFASISTDESRVSDEEIEKLVEVEASSDELSSDSIDKELEEIKKKIDSTN